MHAHIFIYNIDQSAFTGKNNTLYLIKKKHTLALLDFI